VHYPPHRLCVQREAVTDVDAQAHCSGAAADVRVYDSFAALLGLAETQRLSAPTSAADPCIGPHTVDRRDSCMDRADILPQTALC
jgi:hypothetical protein